jgi:hypothetical protein
MKTKLVLTIEVDENFEDTEKLWSELRNKGELKVKDVINSDQIITVIELGDLEAVRDRLCLQDVVNGNNNLPEPKPTRINCIMMTRGV